MIFCVKYGTEDCPPKLYKICLDGNLVILYILNMKYELHRNNCVDLKTGG